MTDDTVTAAMNRGKTWRSGELRIKGDTLEQFSYCLDTGETKVTGKWSLLPLHDSDCAVHNMPAFPNGPCDCSVSER